MRIAIFPCIGLGDGLISCVLANNLRQNGHDITVFHPLMGGLQSFFPDFTFFPRPENYDELKKYDQLIFFYEKLPWMQKGIKQFPEKTIVLNPIATPNTDYLYWGEGEFDGRESFVINLANYAKKKWEVAHPTLSNGITLTPHIHPRKFPKRVILHPVSSRPGKNWSKHKFLSLAKRLEKNGYEPVFILTDQEKAQFREITAPSFSNLEQVATYIAESGWMIGNDSGIGHLASCLGIPTVTICRSHMGASFWKPAWSKAEIIIPPKWIPNLKGMRLRDKKWQAFVPTKRVLNTFLHLTETGVFSD